MTRRRPVPLRTRPRVSVVVPCYNYGRYLPDAVGSALDQSGLDVDVLIVDDCSTDDSAAVALRLADADPRVRLLRHETNRGHIQTYNDGLAAVTGDYVVLLSADDLLTPDSLTRAVALMEAYPRVGLVYGRPASFATEPPPSEARRVSWSTWRGEQWIERICARGQNVISSPEAVLRRSVLNQIGGYDIAHPHAGDLLMWLRAAAVSDVGRVNGAVQAGYRLHEANMHLTRFAEPTTDLSEAGRAFEAFFRAEPALGRLRRTLERGLAREAAMIARAAHPGHGPARWQARAISDAHLFVRSYRWRWWGT
ncbi:glycosyltransferase family 2 protein [Nocardioides nematodiphilus]|uniref:glycosyltransferase family 2 protein n=1 Tax=Nocardioides nematodiphilus TaxID=2849669 RepID=UPI001CD959D2|nr:glycosyltransferase family 2 protein [Nocardioides nematodiphilus]MCA1983054.1 glycosyltransferase [Nocardioides nematodiphilus]